LTASNFNCEIACLSSFVHVNQKWNIRAMRRRVNYQRGFVRIEVWQFRKLCRIKISLISTGGRGNAGLYLGSWLGKQARKHICNIFS